MVSVKFCKPSLGADCRRQSDLFSWVRMVALFSAVATALYVVEARHLSSSKTMNAKEHFENIEIGTRADWKNEKDLPNFCKNILKDPKPLRSDCGRDIETMKCRNGSAYQMFSQFHQDYFLYTRHFKYLNRPGIYLDIAANDPVHISNTYFMDRCLGWKGICVEGNPGYHEKLYRMRSCHLVPTCVGSRDGQSVQFGLKGGAGGIIGNTFKHKDKFAELGVEVPMIRERCTMMRNVLARNGVKQVDFLSLDVEGHELEVLKGFDWDNVVVNLMSIEVSPTSVKEIEEFLTPKGYKRFLPDFTERAERTGLMIEDAIFLHESVEFGKPR
ncbi:hypothetical protein FGB62_14g026 [Gracilaria domingensis]|nr:hypothetical protein FGB62_14g026 [Gracilaria domingensis]